MSTIVRLFLNGSPAAIPWGVGAIIVDAVKLMQRGRLASHIGKEAFVDAPAWIYCDAASAIAFPILVLWIAAAITHTGPCFPFWSASSPIAVASILSSDGRVFGAAAGLHVAVPQIVGRNDMLVAAVTAAKPVRIAVLCMSKRDDSQKIEALRCEVFDRVRHPYRYTIQEG